MNVITWLEIELADFEVREQHISHHGDPSIMLWLTWAIFKECSLLFSIRGSSPNLILPPVNDVQFRLKSFSIACEITAYSYHSPPKRFYFLKSDNALFRDFNSKIIIFLITLLHSNYVPFNPPQVCIVCFLCFLCFCRFLVRSRICHMLTLKRAVDTFYFPTN